MPVTREDAEMLATLAANARPAHARRWDAPGIMAAIGKVRHLELAEVILDAIACAMDPDVATPGAIGKLDWRTRLLRVAGDAPVVRIDPAMLCKSCGKDRAACESQRIPADDHTFITVGAGRADKRPAEAASQIAADIKSRIRPLGDRPQEGEDL